MELIQSIKDIRSKQEQAPRRLYLLTYKKLYALALRYVLSDHLAKDVMQNAYIKIFKNLPSLDLSDEFSVWSWMKKICVNEALMLLRKNKSWSQRQISTTKELVTNNHQDHLLKDEIQKVLMTLPEKQRLVFSLFAIEGFSHKEIAVTMKISETNSRTIYGRTKKSLSNHPILKKIYETV